LSPFIGILTFGFCFNLIDVAELFKACEIFFIILLSNFRADNLAKVLYKKTATLFSHLTGRWLGVKGAAAPCGSGQSPEVELTGTKNVKKCRLILDTISVNYTD
jgi:hypothetical protein